MFISKKLRDSFDKSKESLEGFVQDIAQVSQDIRLLELVLKNYSLSSPFQSLFAHELKLMPVKEQDENGRTYFELHSYEFVSWEINQKEKKSSFRIFYKKYETQLLANMEEASQGSHAEISCTVPKNSKLLEKRPLVETSVLTRLKIYPYLPTFLEELADTLSKNKTKLNFTKFKHSINELEKIVKKRRKT